MQTSFATAARSAPPHHLARDRALTILASMGDALLSVRADGTIDYLNGCAEHLTGWSRDEAYGRPVSEVLVLEEKTAPLAPASTDAVPAPAWGHLPATLCRGERHFRIDGATTTIRDDDGVVDGWVVVFRDVTRSHASLKRLRHEATHDVLTGLANRAEFERRLVRTIERMHGSASTGAVFVLDLDRFKAVNDTGGHGAGDALLAGLADTLSEQLRDRDTLARIGGDEFGVIIERCTRAEADAIAAKLIAATEAYHVRYHGFLYGVGLSVGIAPIDGTTASAKDAVMAADRACYGAKRRRRERGR